MFRIDMKFATDAIPTFSIFTECFLASFFVFIQLFGKKSYAFGTFPGISLFFCSLLAASCRSVVYSPTGIFSCF